MSTAQFEMNAEARADVGKGASRRLRRTGKVPAIIYGGNKEPQAITLAHHLMLQHTDKESFYTAILDINIGGTVEKAVIKDLLWHPYKPVLQHMDFLRVDESSLIKVSIPVHVVNADTAPGVKAGGVASTLLTSIEVSCPAGKLPEYLEVDIAALELGESVHLSEVSLPEGASIVELSHGEGHDQAVVSIMATRASTASEDEEGGADADAGGEAESE